jgi:hypothetical protein
MVAVKSVAKKVLNTSSVNIIEKTGMSMTGHIIQAVFVLLLVIYSGVVVQFLPVSFLSFFDNIIVKIVFLVIIAVVGLFSPAVALFLAIALIVMLQVGQKKQLSNEINTIVNNSTYAPASTYEQEQDQITTNNIMESMNGGDGFLDPELQNGGPKGSYGLPSGGVPNGFNQNDSCLSCGGGEGNSTSQNPQCNSVKTWTDTMGAQGLDGIPGIQSNVGYPL